MRHKGEKRLPKVLDTYSDRHPVAHAIRTGDNWCYAWLAQKCIPEAALTRKTGMSAARLHAIQQGDRVSRAELDALSVVWGVSASDLIASMPDPSIVVD